MPRARRQEQRSRLAIIYDILTVIWEEGGAGPTRIMYRANLSYDRLRRYLALLMEKGMVVEHRDDEHVTYKLTRKGLKALEEMRRIKSMLEAIGLSF